MPLATLRTAWAGGAFTSYLMIVLTLLLGGAFRGPRRGA